MYFAGLSVTVAILHLKTATVESNTIYKRTFYGFLLLSVLSVYVSADN